MDLDGDSLDADRRLTEWVRQYADSLRGYLWTLLEDKSAIEDVLQEVFLRAWRGRDRYVESGRPKAYLFRIADRLVQDQWRSPSRHVPVTDDEAFADPAQEEPLDRLQRQENIRTLRSALHDLTEPQKRTLMLRYFGQLSFEEISGVLGCPLNTTLSHARRGIERLRTLLLAREANS